jgi:hypothetical protein
MQRERGRAAAPAPVTRRPSVATEAVGRIVAELPTARHRQLLIELDGMAHVDAAGRRVAYGKQATLAARLGISRRLLQQLLADLRTPGRDPRHLKVPPAGRRLGLVRVEPTRRPVPDGRSRYGVNVYVLLFAQGAARAMPVQSARPQSARPRADVSAGQLKAHSDRRALHNKRTPSLEEEGGHSRVPTVERGQGDRSGCAPPSLGTNEENSDIGSTVGAATDSTDSDLSPELRPYLEWLRAEHPEYFSSLRRPA